MAEAIIKEFAEEREKRTQDAALTAWLMGAGGKKGWREFCEYYGFVSVEKITEKERKELAKTALEKAKRIAEADKKQNGKNSI